MSETVTMTLTEFLLARIAEDEAVARAAVRWSEGASEWATDGEPDWLHIARHDPARVLRRPPRLSGGLEAVSEHVHEQVPPSPSDGDRIVCACGYSAEFVVLDDGRAGEWVDTAPS